jgi:hypothetical protein
MHPMTWSSTLCALALVVVPSQRVPAPPLPAVPDKNLIYLGQPVAASDVMFRIERTMCFGECPCYVVEVHGDGRVDWQGKEYVVRQTRLQSRIEPEAVQLLLDRAGEIDFFEHAVSFDESGNDGSNCKLTLHIAGQERKADVPHDFDTKSWDGTPIPTWKTMRDEVDFTRAIDALTESWRWINTREDADPKQGDPTTRLQEVPDAFSIGIRRNEKYSYPAYTLMLDAAGGGTWHGAAHVREIGDRTFTVSHVEMQLLASRAQRLVGLGKNYTLDEMGEVGTDLFVHAKGLKPVVREHLASGEKPESALLSTDFVKARAVVDLVDVIARTSHFAGSWDEQQEAVAATPPAPK